MVRTGPLTSLPPSNIPTEITEKLKKMLEATNEEIVDITARKLISSM